MLSEIDTRPFPQAPPAFNLAGHVLARAASLDKPALAILHPEADETLTYAQLLCLTQGCGTALLALGLTPGDRILLRLGNTLAFPILYLGAIWAGLVPIPTSTALTGPEITKLAARVQPNLIAAEPGIPLPDHPAPILSPDLSNWARTPPPPSTSATRTERPTSSSPPAPRAPRWPSPTPTAPFSPAPTCTSIGRA